MQPYNNAQSVMGNFSGAYWSSTENSPNNQNSAFTQNFNHQNIIMENIHNKEQATDNCRCVRKAD